MASCARGEVQTEEVEAEERTCRLCFGDAADGPLVQPCACRGSAKWIHQHCLEQWRRTGPREDAAYRCGQCMDEYRDALSIELLSARLQADRTDGEDKVKLVSSPCARSTWSRALRSSTLSASRYSSMHWPQR